jgi:hypothetical protein
VVGQAVTFGDNELLPSHYRERNTRKAKLVPSAFDNGIDGWLCITRRELRGWPSAAGTREGQQANNDPPHEQVLYV